jgi:hypothetical protein
MYKKKGIKNKIENNQLIFLKYLNISIKCIMTLLSQQLIQYSNFGLRIKIERDAFDLSHQLFWQQLL